MAKRVMSPSTASCRFRIKFGSSRYGISANSITLNNSRFVFLGHASSFVTLIPSLSFEPELCRALGIGKREFERLVKFVGQRNFVAQLEDDQLDADAARG